MHQRYEVGLQTTESKIISRAAAKCLEALCGQSTLQEAMLIWSLIARWAPKPFVLRSGRGELSDPRRDEPRQEPDGQIGTTISTDFSFPERKSICVGICVLFPVSLMMTICHAEPSCCFSLGFYTELYDKILNIREQHCTIWYIFNNYLFQICLRVCSTINTYLST